MKTDDKKTYLSIAEARKARNISQLELSKMSGIIQADISRIENGKANPTINVLKRLAEAMGMTLNIYFEDK
jgi:transcriptional regulator with XRE-family HTH domain